VIAYRTDYVEMMDTMLPDHRGTVMIDGAGHWTQQERPEEFNAALLRFVADIDG
jgi:pimeloyl-ACP methyl ester carboxylesterase